MQWGTSPLQAGSWTKAAWRKLVALHQVCRWPPSPAGREASPLCPQESPLCPSRSGWQRGAELGVPLPACRGRHGADKQPPSSAGFPAWGGRERSRRERNPRAAMEPLPRGPCRQRPLGAALGTASAVWPHLRPADGVTGKRKNKKEKKKFKKNSTRSAKG